MRMLTIVELESQTYHLILFHVALMAFFFGMQFVMETWRLMEDKEIGVDKLCYFLIIQALCKGGYLEEV